MLMQYKRKTPTTFKEGKVGNKLQRRCPELLNKELLINTINKLIDFTTVTDEEDKNFANVGFNTLEKMKKNVPIGVDICEYVNRNKEVRKVFAVFKSQQLIMNA